MRVERVVRRPGSTTPEPGSPPNRLRLGRVGRLGSFTVSLERPTAFRYLLDSLYPPHGGRERLRLSLARRLPWGLAAAWVLQTRSTAGSAPEELPLLGKLAERSDLLDRTTPASGPLSWIAGRRGGDPSSEMVFLLPEAGPDPAAVLQLCPAADVTAFGDEAGAVRWLGSSLSSPLAEKVPRVLLHEVRGELEVLALSALPGTSAYVELRRRGPSGSLATRHLDAAVDWLVPFQRETRSERRWRLPSWSELAPPGTDPATEPDWFRLLRDGLDRRPLPRVGRHGDYWPRNLLLGAEGGVSGVVDWEAFRTNASPLDDLFDFALAYGESVSGGGSPGSLDSFLGTFGEGAFPGPRVWTYVRQTLAGLGVEPGLDRPLLGVYLLERARRVGVGPRSRLARDRPASFWLECFRRWSP